jgi:hypothetical protein
MPVDWGLVRDYVARNDYAEETRMRRRTVVLALTGLVFVGMVVRALAPLPKDMTPSMVHYLCQPPLCDCLHCPGCKATAGFGRSPVVLVLGSIVVVVRRECGHRLSTTYPRLRAR